MDSHQLPFGWVQVGLRGTSEFGPGQENSRLPDFKAFMSILNRLENEAEIERCFAGDMITPSTPREDSAYRVSSAASS